MTNTITQNATKTSKKGIYLVEDGLIIDVIETELKSLSWPLFQLAKEEAVIEIGGKGYIVRVVDKMTPIFKLEKGNFGYDPRDALVLSEEKGEIILRRKNGVKYIIEDPGFSV